MLNLNKEDIINLFKKETDDFIIENYTTRNMKEMYYTLTEIEINKKKKEIIKIIRRKIK